MSHVEPEHSGARGYQDEWPDPRTGPVRRVSVDEMITRALKEISYAIERDLSAVERNEIRRIIVCLIRKWWENL
jgi:hypothetical protein